MENIKKFKLVTEKTFEKDCFYFFLSYVLVDKTVRVVLKSITNGRKKLCIFVEIKEA